MLFIPPTQKKLRGFTVWPFQTSAKSAFIVWHCVIGVGRQNLTFFDNCFSHMSCLLFAEPKILPLLVELSHCAFSTEKPERGCLVLKMPQSPIESSCNVRWGEVLEPTLDEASNHRRVSPQTILLVLRLSQGELAIFDNHSFWSWRRWSEFCKSRLCLGLWAGKQDGAVLPDQNYGKQWRWNINLTVSLNAHCYDDYLWKSIIILTVYCIAHCAIANKLESDCQSKRAQLKDTFCFLTIWYGPRRLRCRVMASPEDIEYVLIFDLFGVVSDSNTFSVVAHPRMTN